MKKIDSETAEMLAAKMRSEYLRISGTEPLNAKTALRQLNIMAVFSPMSDKIFGLSIVSPDRKNRFMLVNSNITRGAQHFTVAHELYHLYFDENPQPHFCSQPFTDPAERSANMFASALLMPKDGIIMNIPAEELKNKEVGIDTVIRLEHLYGISHKTMVVRLKELHIIKPDYADMLASLVVTREAALRGFGSELYQRGDGKRLVIGDFGAKARKLFEEERISEGHYIELLNLIGYGENQGSAGC
ncbi:MAG: ImmA/IrrE family metallo-endopeptidase [Bacteroidales bacterium]|nr:ImmA/IrrE family metallo-endopeptidase [Bacteroidales bacterium]